MEREERTKSQAALSAAERIHCGADAAMRGSTLRRLRFPTAVLLGAAATWALAGCSGFAPGDPPATSAAPAVVFPVDIQSTADAPAVVWAVGDGADGGQPAVALARRIARSRVDSLLYLGDVYETGTDQEFQTNFSGVYGALAARTYPTPGNHDWPNRQEGYFPYWSRVLQRPVPSYDVRHLGGWDLLSLNSEEPHEPGSRQLAWLQSQVRAPGTCRLAFWHRPRYSAGWHGDQPDIEPLWQVLRGHSTLVLNGHDHDLQRLKPVGGMTEFVVGAGGQEFYKVNRQDSRLAFANDTTYGALRLALRPGVAEYQIVSTDGRTLDAGRIPCQPS